MLSYIQILGAGTPDGGTGLFVFFDDKRYLFSCSEGIQRFCTQHHIKVSKISAIFLTRLEWERTGGLPGMICTLADGGMSALKMVGPKGTSHLIGSLRGFLRRSRLGLTIVEHLEATNDLIYQDELIKVRAVEIFVNDRIDDVAITKKGRISPPQTIDIENLHVAKQMANEFVVEMFKDPNHFDHDAGNDNGGEESVKPLKSHDRMPFFEYRASSLCYLIEGPLVPGKFDADKARSAGIPAGPLYGLLAKGETITLTDGTMIHPEDCIGPSTPGPMFVIIDTRDIRQLAELSHKIDRFVNERVTLVFHFCSEDIWRDSFYADTIRSKFSSAEHVWIDENNSELIYSSSYEVLERLRDEVDSDIFHPPLFTTPGRSSNGAKALTKYYWYSPGKCSLAEATGVATHIGSTNASLVSYDPTFENPVVTFLGTGAASPGKYRNVSSTLVDFGNVAYLFDCGEATYGQLFRRFGRRAIEIIDRLVIFVSHLHTDHQLGLLGILSRRKHPLGVVAPSRYKVFLDEMGECADLHQEICFYSAESLVEDGPIPDGFLGQLLLKSCRAVPVIHCPQSYGYVLRHVSGIQIAYSGDTRPCRLLATKGKGSDILIHEATFGDELQVEAIDKRHSTISEAISVGKEMGARFTLLTHISQRYSKTLPPFDWENTSGILPVMDFMSISLDQLRRINLRGLVSAMRAHLPDSDDVQLLSPQHDIDIKEN